MMSKEERKARALIRVGFSPDRVTDLDMIRPGTTGPGCGRTRSGIHAEGSRSGRAR
jgi:hypothetical protein